MDYQDHNASRAGSPARALGTAVRQRACPAVPRESVRRVCSRGNTSVHRGRSLEPRGQRAEGELEGRCRNYAPPPAFPAPPPPPFPTKATGAGGTPSSLDCGAAPRTRRTRSLPRRPLRASFWKTEGKEEKVVTACGSCYERNGICDGEKPVLDIRAPGPFGPALHAALSRLR